MPTHHLIRLPGVLAVCTASCHLLKTILHIIYISKFRPHCRLFVSSFRKVGQAPLQSCGPRGALPA